ncbi:MAG TPA: alpha/beta fold hydrolase [Candidatus Cybelea sp.]|nr:alpha/beta fold hydrolase [Candidatus Cybelea sp.]
MSTTDNSFYYRGGRAGVLLIHGLTGTPTEMRFVGRGLAQAGFTVYGMQLDGHCGSEADLLATRWPDWYASVERAYEHFRRDVDVVFAGGLSMGAVLAMHLAAQRPGAVQGMALYSTTLWYDGWTIPVTRHLMPLLPIVVRLPFGKRRRFAEAFPYGIKDDRLRQRVVSNMLSGASGAAGLPSTPWPSLHELNTLVRIVCREMPAITTPTLIMHARDDDMTATTNADYIERRLGGLVRKVILDDCYHMITVDRQRGDVVRESAEFFTGLSRISHFRAVHEVASSAAGS